MMVRAVPMVIFAIVGKSGGRFRRGSAVFEENLDSGGRTEETENGLRIQEEEQVIGMRDDR
jgi:hypothetical protein